MISICKLEKNLIVISYDSKPGQPRQIFAVVTVQEVYSAQNSKVFEIVGRSELETQSMSGNIVIIAMDVSATAQAQFTSAFRTFRSI